MRINKLASILLLGSVLFGSLLLAYCGDQRVSNSRKSHDLRSANWGVVGGYFSDEINAQRGRGALRDENYGQAEIVRILRGENRAGMNSLDRLTASLCVEEDGRLFDQWGSEIVLCITGDVLVMVSAGPDRNFNGGGNLSTDDLTVVIPLSLGVNKPTPKLAPDK